MFFGSKYIYKFDAKITRLLKKEVKKLVKSQCVKNKSNVEQT